DLGNAGRDQRIAARRRLPVMAAWLERYISRSAARRRYTRSQRVDFGMRLTEPLMQAFANDLPILHNHTADHRIRLNRSTAARGQFERTAHAGHIERGELNGGIVRGFAAAHDLRDSISRCI